MSIINSDNIIFKKAKKTNKLNFGAGNWPINIYTMKKDQEIYLQVKMIITEF